MDGIAPNAAQQIRDDSGLGSTCAACGHLARDRNPLVIAADGYRIHVAHLLTFGDGYYGVPFARAS